MKTSKILIAAKRHLQTGKLEEEEEEGKTRYVCWAIEGTDHIEGRKVITRIEKTVGKCNSVRNWLIANGHTTPEQCTFKAMQEYRHRWLDALIEEYRAAGD